MSARTRPPVCPPRPLRFETCEERSMLTVTAIEQYFAYRINYVRDDPGRYEVEAALSVDLDYAPAMPPLRVIDSLFDSGEAKVNDMIAGNYFGHLSPVTGLTANKVVRNAGYPLPATLPVGGLNYTFPDSGNSVESIAAGYTTADLALKALIEDIGTSPPGHRNHMLGLTDPYTAYRDIGIGHAFGAGTTYGNYWAIHAAALNTTQSYLTGVVYNDVNTNGKMDLGEGLSGVTVSIPGASTTTNAGGGWSLAAANGTYQVQATGGAFSGTSVVSAQVAGSNVEVDFRSGIAGGQVAFTQVNSGPALAASYSATVPTIFTANEVKTFAVTLTNTGSTTWTAGGANPVHLGVYFSAVSGTSGDALSEPARFNLPADLAPGASVTVNVSARAPAFSAGATSLRLRMVKEGVSWFPQLSSTNVSVVTGQALSAAYSSNAPSIFTAGEEKTFSVTLTNTGTTTWNAGGANPVNLGVYFSAVSGTTGDALNEPRRFSLPSNVAPGTSVTFTVAARAPALTAGANSLRLRLVKEGVSWFPELLKVPIAVVSGQALSAAYSGTVPTLFNADERKTFDVTVTNTGTTTWTAGGANPVHIGVYFSAVSGTSSDALSEPVRFNLPADLAPGASVTVNVAARAPAAATGANTLRVRMVKEGIGWFPELLKTNIGIMTTKTLAAAYSAVLPTTWAANEVKTVSVTLTNTGTTTWTAGGATPVQLGTYFTGNSDAIGDWRSEPVRSRLPNDVAPGQSVTFNFTIRAPAAAGSYTLRLRMVKEGVAWFSELAKQTVTVN